MESTNKTAIITGGGRGIGRAIAIRLAKQFNILVVGRTEKDLAEVSQIINKNSGRADYVVGDVSDPKTAQKSKKLLLKHGWEASCLVCNAGIGKSGPTATFDKKIWREIFDVNVHGAFYFTQEFLPLMLENGGGVICIISSIAGLKGIKYSAGYSASKHALVGLAKSLAEEYGKRGIIAVPICPGFVEGEMTDRTIHGLMERHKISEDNARQRVLDLCPQKRIIPAEEVAEAVSFICSDKVPSLSGSPLILNGGL